MLAILGQLEGQNAASLFTRTPVFRSLMTTDLCNQATSPHVVARLDVVPPASAANSSFGWKQNVTKSFAIDSE